MPLNLPSVLQLFKPTEPNAQRFLPPIERTVTQVLTFLRGSFDDAANGGMRILKPLILKTLSVDSDVTLNGITTTQDLTVQGTLTTSAKRAQFRAGIDTPSGIKTILGQFGYSGNTTAGTYYNLGAAYYSNNVNMVMPFRGSLIGACIALYSATATTVQTFYTGFSPGEYRQDVTVPANQYVMTYFSLFRGDYSFQVGSGLVFKAYTPNACSGFSCCITPFIELST